MTHASYRFRRAGYTAEILHRERTHIVPDLLPDARDDWDAMMRIVSSTTSTRPRFTTRDGRAALRTSWRLGTSPLAQWARCYACASTADECECATDSDGVLYIYTCPYCDAACADGEPCCDPPEDEDDDAEEYSNPAPHGDGYSRGSWEPIYRRDIMMHGQAEAWAPYFVGIELETDSTPTPSDWTMLRSSDLLLGAWHDGTVRGPEIVSQPARGNELANIVDMFASLRVSLTSVHATSAHQCGMHVHVDARHMTARAKKAFVRLWMAVREDLWSHPDMHLRGGGGYAVRLSTAEAAQAIDRIGGSDTEWPTRYRDLNCAALGEHSTFEVRLFGWPSVANTWGVPERRDYMLRCIRWVQALRAAAKFVGESELGASHPVYALDPHEALALVESLVPLHASYSGGAV